MKDRAHENLIELLRQFMEEPGAQEAQEDIQAGERWLDACPAPPPPSRVIAAIHRQMALSARRRHRIVRLIHTSVAAAAAIVILALIGQLGPRPVRRPHALHMAFIPTAIWESDDLTTDDLDLAYYSGEIRQIEAQMHALEAGDSDVSGNDASDELEMELLAIQADFWKG
jgi:hypothetical protein